MKTVVGIITGLLSGILIYFMAAMLFMGEGGPSPLFIITLFGGWILSSFIILRGTQTVSKVFSRSFLLGAAEWLAMIPVGVISAGKIVTETVVSSGGSNAEATGAAIGGGFIAFLTGGVSIFMVIVCLAGFAVTYFIGREMKTEMVISTKKCPECAELIQAEAKKCPFCGTSLM